jgi:GT2 family glycosyltransferase
MKSGNNKNPKIYIIIINVNSYKDTIECINSIINNNYSNYTLVIIENSHDEKNIIQMTSYFNNIKLKFSILNREDIENYSAVTRSENKNIVIIRNKKVSGFSENNNIGIKYAQKINDYDYIWLLNNDTVIKRDSLYELVKYSENNPECGIIGSVLIYYNDQKKIQAIGGGINTNILGGIKTYCKNRNIIILDELKDYEINKKLNMISGASFLIRKEVIESIGLMDERFFLYGEDLDYSARTIKSGWNIGVALNSIVFHKHNSLTKKKSKEFYYYHNSRSFTIYLKKNTNIIMMMLGLFSHFLNSMRKYPSIKCFHTLTRGIASGLKVKI